MITINIAREYTPLPGPRYREQGFVIRNACPSA